jgi:multicomponent Na+:H+ antiporter subunit E
MENMTNKFDLAKRFTLAGLILFGTWMMMVGNFHPQEIIAGVVVSLIISYLALPKMTILNDIRLGIGLPIYFLIYLYVFVRALIASNIDMAKRVISPALPIYPSIVEIQTQLHSPLGKLMLANSITLTPGTLTVEVNEDRLRIHWIDTRSMDELHSATRLIAEQFEKPLLRFIR